MFPMQFYHLNYIMTRNSLPLQGGVSVVLVISGILCYSNDTIRATRPGGLRERKGLWDEGSYPEQDEIAVSMCIDSDNGICFVSCCMSCRGIYIQ